jgi:3-phosphoglycerate kinase
MQLVSTSMPGNVHVASQIINEMGLADNVIYFSFGGGATIVVFRVTDEEAPRLRAQFGYLPEHINNPIVKPWEKPL